jgi:hypothetical protein
MTRSGVIRILREHEENAEYTVTTQTIYDKDIVTHVMVLVHTEARKSEAESAKPEE